MFSIPAKSNVVVKLLAQPKIATAVSFHGKASDEPYRFGMSVLEMSVLEAGEYTLVVSTFEKSDMSQAFLLVGINICIQDLPSLPSILAR